MLRGTARTLGVTLLVVAAMATGSVGGVENVGETGSVGERANGATEVTPPTPIAGCTAIASPGTYELANDVTSTAPLCIRIVADDVHFDGGGHTIDKQGVGVGIAATGVSNVTVENVTVVEGAFGVRYRNVVAGSVESSTVERNQFGIGLAHSQGNRIEVVDARRNGVGIRLVESTSNYLTDLHAVENRGDGILVGGGGRNTIHALNATGNGDAGIKFRSTMENSVTFVDADRNRVGVVLLGGTNNRLLRNEIQQNAQSGVELLQGSDGNQLFENEVLDSGNVGIAVQSDRNTLVRNAACGHATADIDVSGVSNLLFDNVADTVTVANPAANTVVGTMAC